MVQHGFDPADHTLNELIEFCECFEYTEDHDPASVGQKPKPQVSGLGESKSSHAKSFAKGNFASGRSQTHHSEGQSDDSKHKRAFDPNAWCQLHEKVGHWTDDCDVVKVQITAMKGAYQAHKRANTNLFDNKSWQRKPAPGADASKMPSHQQKSKNELHALMDQEINRHVTQRMKKRQHAADDESVHAFEQLSISDDDEDSSHFKKNDLDDELHA
jgi:hypothetical protein